MPRTRTADYNPDELARFLRRLRDAKGMSNAAVARVSHLSPVYVGQLMHGEIAQRGGSPKKIRPSRATLLMLGRREVLAMTAAEQRKALRLAGYEE